MPDTKAQIVLDSAHPQGDNHRLTAFLVRYPKFVHAEHMRHRTGSYCVSSSRAVPVSKNLEEVRNDDLRAGPVFWGAEQRGMQSGDELDDKELNYNSHYAGYPTSQRQAAKDDWKKAALDAVKRAEYMHNLGVHKSIVNRLLEPFLHVNVLVTSCAPGLLNFFGLRLDRAAQPEIKALAEAMWIAWNESKPKLLHPGEWHLPFIDERTWDEIGARAEHYDFEIKEAIEVPRRISVARCARLSYTSFETNRRSTIDEDLKLYDRLIGSKPIHASPAEHQATPDKRFQIPIRHHVGFRNDNQESIFETTYEDGKWMDEDKHGNLHGWIQHRKLLPNEAVANLPEGYTYDP